MKVFKANKSKHKEDVDATSQYRTPQKISVQSQLLENVFQKNIPKSCVV